MPECCADPPTCFRDPQRRQPRQDFGRSDMKGRDPVTREIQPVFLVGTGRCGSTMLSNMIREHADILSVSEFLVSVTDFAGRIPQAFPEGGCMDARQVWEVLAGLHPRQTVMLRHGVEMDEMLYPLSPASRFSRQSGVPAILLTTLPHLTADHDAFFEEL